MKRRFAALALCALAGTQAQAATIVGSSGSSGSVLAGDSGAVLGSSLSFSAATDFSGPEFFDIDIGNPLGVGGATDWTLPTPALRAGDRVSLTAAADVPEPQTWALMLAGLGLVGFVACRRMTGPAPAFFSAP